MMQQQGQSDYGRYEGRSRESMPPPYEQPGSVYDDEFVEILSQRISQRMAQGPVGKIQPLMKARRDETPNLPFVLALISILALIPLAIILVPGGGVGGLLAFGGLCLTLFLINAVFAEYSKHANK